MCKPIMKPMDRLSSAAPILAHHFNCQDYDNILERLQERIQEEKQITFEEFKDLFTTKKLSDNKWLK